jgi:nucleotide-binding universal stress UspA family protein
MMSAAFAAIDLGSATAERVVLYAPCSVLVVAGAATPWKSSLCSVDFSAPSRGALLVAADLAEEHGARLTLVHAFPMALMFDAARQTTLERLRGLHQGHRRGVISGSGTCSASP